MRLGLSSKLFMAVLLIVIVVGAGYAARVSFNRDFLSYLTKQEFDRMGAIAPLIEQAYAEHGSWQFIHDDPRNWFDLAQKRSSPRHLTIDEWNRHPLTLLDYAGTINRLTLLDASGKQVIGNPNPGPNAPRLPLVVKGQTIGWLVMLPFRDVVDATAFDFQQRQHQGQLIIGASALLLAALLAILVSRSVLRPVRRLAAATHALAQGDYSARAQVSERDELGQLAQDFDRLARVLEKNEHMRRDFVADISHELRTPLAIMQAEFEVLEDGVRPINLDAVRSLRNEANTLSKLVDDLYQLSLAETGVLSYRMSSVEVGEWINSTLDTFNEQLQQAELTLQLLPAPHALHIEADENRLRQLLANLLQNTLRYTDRGGQLRVAYARVEQYVQIDLMDSSPGVDARALPQLFERFYRQESSRTRSKGGAGLGLAICRAITEAHGGTIEARPSPLGGLWLQIRLPLSSS